MLGRSWGKLLLGPKLVQVITENIQVIRERLLIAQSGQKNYVEQIRRELEFYIGEHIFLKVLPSKGIMRLENKEKLSPRFIVPFEILRKMGDIDYELALLLNFSHVHSIFHVSMLRNYMHNPSHVLEFEPVQVKDDLSYDETLV